MKVTGTGATQSASGSKKSRKSSGASGTAFADAMRSADGVSSAGGAAPMAGVGGVSALDALLSVQAEGDATDGGGRRQAMARAEDLLDRLEDLRDGILMGRIPKERLNGLIASLNERRSNVEDEKLVEILDEIELRARVELAKYTASR